jgi:uncharacterized protein YceH (UPF0502 family)
MKYEHWLGEAFNFSRAETALICVLLLRGPQTPGELRGRTERMHRFDEISDVLAGSAKADGARAARWPLCCRASRARKESRYAHLLSGPVEVLQAAVAETASVGHDSGEGSGHEELIAQLEAAVAEFRQEIAALRQRIDDLFGD